MNTNTIETLEIIDDGDTTESIPFLLDENTPVNRSPFIEANTIESSLEEIKKRHIIPVFIKDNEPVISHSEFIETAFNAAKDIFNGEAILRPNIRLSHPIKGRIPEAKNKAAKELAEHEKTLYYERMAFSIEIPSIGNYVNGNRLNLTIGGVKAYNLDNLYNKSGADQHFKIFIGFQNKVCTNMCISSDGYVGDLKVKDLEQLKDCFDDMLTGYDGLNHLQVLESLTQYKLTEQQFAQMLGRCRMYKHLKDVDKGNIPPLLFGDNQMNTVCKDYYRDNNFCRSTDGNLNLWNLYNLFTGANKASYIDNFLDRSLNAYHFTQVLKNSLQHKNECWYLN